VIGVALALVGVIGLVLDRGDSKPAAASGLSTTTRGATTSAAPPSSVTTSASTTRAPTTTTAPPESPADFAVRLGEAIKTSDVEFLLTHLHDAVIRRYGADQCRAYLPTIGDPTAEFRVKSVSEPGPYDYAVDGRSEIVPDTYTLAVDRVIDGQPVALDIHLARVGKEIRWFTDCGDPV
jgi:hypothetical protein